MRKDVKTGLIIGTGLCFAAVVWFCFHNQVVQQPRIEELLSQKKYFFTKAESAVKSSSPVINFKDDQSQPQISPDNAPSIRIHIVAQGQTLSDISKIYYGTVSGWKKIYEANKTLLPRGPDTIKAGMKLSIPQQ